MARVASHLLQHTYKTQGSKKKKNVYDSAPVLITPDPTVEEAAGLLERSMSFAIFLWYSMSSSI